MDAWDGLGMYFQLLLHISGQFLPYFICGIVSSTLGQTVVANSLGVLPVSSTLVSVPLWSATGNPPTNVSWAAHPITTPAMAQPATPVSAPGFSLSPALEPIPQRLVGKIQSGQYVDMKELLTDNVSLLQQLEAVGGQGPSPSLPGVLKPRLRDITSLSTWMYCFLAYVAVRSPDKATQDMLAYARLMIREAQRHGGTSWLDYDRVFRQQIAIDPSLRWNTLEPGIQAGTLSSRPPTTGTFCTLCREPDHSASACALAYLQPQNPAVSTPTRMLDTPRYSRRNTPSRQGICISWNRGRCIFPNTCTYRHTCATCQQRHQARSCPETPQDSWFKREPRGSGRGPLITTAGK